MTVKTFIAGADLTDKIGYAVKADTTNKQVVLAGANAACLGLLANDNKSGKAVSVALTGEVVKAKLGAGVAYGAALKADTNGALITAGGSADDNVIAIALEAGSTGDLIYVEVVKFVK